MKIAQMGAGKMGASIVAALSSGERAITSPENISIFDTSSERARVVQAASNAKLAHSPEEAIDGADFVIFAVQPPDFDAAAGMVGGRLGQATAVSIMAGVTLEQLRKSLRTDNVVRAMPNTPAQIGEGMTVWTAMPAVTDTARAEVRRIFGALGKEAYVPEERYLDMATGLSGSGPAYVFLFIEALTDAGVHVGLPRDLAETMALQTVIGSARYAENTGKHPAELRNQVTSPGGTTAEALRAFERGAFRADVLEAVIAAYNKSRALGEASQK